MRRTFSLVGHAASVLVAHAASVLVAHGSVTFVGHAASVLVHKTARAPAIVVLAALAVFAPAARAAPSIDLTTFRVQHGDDARWSAPELDDTTWPHAELPDITAPGGPLWLRATLTLEPTTFPIDQPIGVLFAGLASHEIYWDGVRIGASGTIGHSTTTEIPGRLTARHWLPPQLATPGHHVIALRLSAYHRTLPVQQPLWLVRIGSYDQLGAAPSRYVWIAIASCSGLVLGAVFALVMFFYHRRDRAFLQLCALCLAAVALLVVESWRPLFGYTYNWHGARLLLIASLTWILEILVVAFTVVRLPRPTRRHRRFVALAATAMACAWLAPSWDLRAWLMFLIGQTFAFAWTLRAVRVRQRGSRPLAIALAASLITLLAAPELFADVSVFLLLDFLLLCLVVPYAIERAQERTHRERALITAARLETELVRKHLQPHFLMNTLTALSEWVDEDPRVAGEMIGALADELRLLHDILDRPLITMDEELRLCHAHLAIMSRRKGRAYRLVTHGVDTTTAIPPAVFHTLVENAVTHGANPPALVELTLTATTLGDRVRYTFEAPLSTPPAPARPEGAGTRYIRARLHESFGTHWTFTAAAVADTWRTELEIPARSP